MRRRPFFIVPLVALVTFVALSAFVDRRNFGPHGVGWRHHHCNDSRYHPTDSFNHGPHGLYR